MSFLTLPASFYAARSLLRCATDLEKRCRKSHSNTSSVTRLTGRKMVLGSGGRLDARASANLSQKNVEVERACGGGCCLQGGSPKSPQRRLPTDPASGGGARATNCLEKSEIGRLGTGRLEIGRLWEGLVRVARFVRPELCPGKVLASWNLAFKTPQPPALPEAARRARGPNCALKLRRAHGETN